MKGGGGGRGLFENQFLFLKAISLSLLFSLFSHSQKKKDNLACLSFIQKKFLHDILMSSNYHLPTIAAVAGIALAASTYVISNNSYETKRRKRRVRSKIQRGTILKNLML